MVITSRPCACGCGILTDWATRGRGGYGYRRGEPLRYRQTHNHRGLGQSPREHKYVEVAPFREAFLASGLTTYMVALRAGWMTKIHGQGQYPDGYRVKRALGLRPYVEGNGYSIVRVREHMNVSTAATLARAMDLDFGEFGL